MKYCTYILFILVQFISLLAFAQNKQLKFERIGTKEGLSDPIVLCMMQDSRGFIWVGTRNGLNRYDGHQFRVYYSDPADSVSLSGNYIQKIIEDSKGNIWIATSRGLNKFDRKKNRFKQFTPKPNNPNSLSGNNISNIIEDHTGKFWIATEYGVNLFNPETNHFTRFFHDKNDPTTISGNYITSALADSRGDIWFGTLQGGLNKFISKDSTFIRYQADSRNSEAISGNSIYTIFEDSHQRLWIGTTGEGLNLFDRETGKFRQFKHTSDINSLSGTNVLCINEDDNGNLLIGIENGGICFLDSTLQRFSNYINDEIDVSSLSANSVYSIIKDNEGNIWIGVFAGGINLYKKSTASFNHFRHNSSASSLSNNFVLSIYEDRDENLWIGTDGGGLNCFNQKTGKSYLYKQNSTQNSVAGNYILTLTEDNKNNLWIGTWGNGMSKLNLKTRKFTNFKPNNNNKPGLSNDDIYCITVTRDGKIWIGTFGSGLDIYDDQSNSFINFRNNKNDKNSLSDNKIYTIFEDKIGNIWIGTAEGGINLFKPKTNSFIRFNQENNNLASNTVYQITENRSGTIYACTAGDGLKYFDPSTNRFISIESQNKFTSEFIYAALEDQKGNIWVSSSKGISKYDPETKAIKNYSVEDGLQGDEFKPHSAFRAKSGMLYFGGINGYNSFLPDQIIENKYNPPIVLTDFQIFNKSISIAKDENDPSPLKQDISETKSIRLSYNQSVITFEFASLDFSSPDKKSYTYMLEGFDDDWNMVGSKNSATYTKLDPGDYVFKVKSQNRSGEWSSQILKLDVTIVPPFWLTWWFKTLMGIILVISPLVFIYWRIKQLRNQKNLLEKLVVKRTNEIQSKNELLKSQALSLVQKNEQLKDLNSTKNKLFSIISHDLRSPFNSILGFHDLLLNNYDEFSETDRKNMIRQVHSTTNQAYYLVENLLNWARIQTSNIQYNPVRINVNKMFDEKLDLYRDIAEAKGISFDHQLTDGLIAFADINLLETTLRNLINNAIKFTPVGGSILIKADKENDVIIISVSDSGTGMTKEDVGTLFYLDKTHTKNGTNGEKGSGLGLVLCKEFVEMNHGDITVESQVGKGSTFSFTIPVAPVK